MNNSISESPTTDAKEINADADLLPCPFCGGEMERCIPDPDALIHHKDRGSKCHLNRSLARLWCAARDWNTRARTPADHVEFNPHEFVGIGAGELGVSICEREGCDEPERSPVHAAKFRTPAVGDTAQQARELVAEFMTNGVGQDECDRCDFDSAICPHLQEDLSHRITTALDSTAHEAREAERERCAKIAEDRAADYEKLGDYGVNQGYVRKVEAANDIAERIRFQPVAAITAEGDK